MRYILIAVVIFVAIIVVAVVVAGFAFAPAGSVGIGRQTWQQYGMSIQYPAGVNAQYKGVLDQQADSASGGVEWLWNGGNTGLVVAWATTTSFNVAGSFQGVYNALLAKASNVSTTNQGTVTMGGHSWQYQTYSFVYGGQTVYVTYAVAYYSNSGRGYVLGFLDTSNTTLSSLQSYGNTFSG